MLDKIRKRVKNHIEHFGYEITSDEEDEIATLYELNNEEYDENILSLHIENYMKRKKMGDADSEKTEWSKSRRKTVFARLVSTENFEIPNYVKEEKTFDFLSSRLGTNIPFCLLSEEQKNVLIGSMFPIIVEAESILIREGDLGAEMYIIEYGEFEVSVNGHLTNKLLPGAVFGELALLHGIPRTATVKAISKSKVWSAEQTSFSCIRMRDQIYRKAVAKEVIKNFLTSVKTFMSTEGIDKLVSLSQNRYIKAGTFVKLDGREMIILLKEALIEDDTRRKVFPKDILNKDFHSISDVDCISINLGDTLK